MALGPTANVVASLFGAVKGLGKYIIPGAFGVAAAETLTNTDGKGGWLTNWGWRRPSQIAALETSATQGIEDLFDKISGASNNVTTFFAGTLATICDFLAYVGFEPAAKWATSLRGFEQRTQRIINSRVQAGREGVTETANGAVPSNAPEASLSVIPGVSNNIAGGVVLGAAGLASHAAFSHFGNKAAAREAASAAQTADRALSPTEIMQREMNGNWSEINNRNSADNAGRSTLTPEAGAPRASSDGPSIKGTGGKAALFTGLAVTGAGLAGATLMAPNSANAATPGRANATDVPQAPSTEARVTEGVMGGMAALTAIETAKGAGMIAKEGILFAGKRLPVVGGVVTLAFSVVSAAESAWKGEYGRAAAELGTGVAEAAVNTTGLGLIGGGDAVREGLRLGVQTVAGDAFAPDKSGIRSLVEHYAGPATGSKTPTPATAPAAPAYRLDLNQPSPFVGMP